LGEAISDIKGNRGKKKKPWGRHDGKGLKENLGSRGCDRFLGKKKRGVGVGTKLMDSYLNERRKRKKKGDGVGVEDTGLEKRDEYNSFLEKKVKKLLNADRKQGGGRRRKKGRWENARSEVGGPRKNHGILSVR